GSPPRQALTWQQRQALIPGFEADIRLLEVITGEDFGDWLQPRGESGGLVGARPAGPRHARNGQPRSVCRGGSRSAPLRAPLLCPVGPRHLVVVPLTGVAEVKDAEVAQPAGPAGRLRDGPAGGQGRGPIARGEAGPLLEVLRRAGPPVVIG